MYSHLDCTLTLYNIFTHHGSNLLFSVSWVHLLAINICIQSFWQHTQTGAAACGPWLQGQTVIKILIYVSNLPLLCRRLFFFNAIFFFVCSFCHLVVCPCWGPGIVMSPGKLTCISPYVDINKTFSCACICMVHLCTYICLHVSICFIWEGMKAMQGRLDGLPPCKLLFTKTGQWWPRPG